MHSYSIDLTVVLVSSWAVAAFLLLVAFHHLVRAQHGRGRGPVPGPGRSHQAVAERKQIPTKPLVREDVRSGERR